MADTFTPNLRLIQQVNGSNPTTWGDKVDQNWDRVDSKVAGVTVLVVSGGTVTLLEADEEVAVIDVAGSLVGNLTIVFSGRRGTWVVRNRTGGAFSVNCKVAGQPGIFVTQAFTANVWCDGADIASKIESTARLIGEIIPYAGINEQPQTKWCNGQALNRVLYPRLFAEIGTFYGIGDGVSTFNVPDLCGRVPAGQDDMGGIASKGRLTIGMTNGLNGSVLGSFGGSDRHTIVIAEAPSHSHDTSGTTLHGTAHHHDKGTFVLSNESDHTHPKGTLAGDSAGAHTHKLTTASASSNGAHTHGVSGTAALITAGTPTGTVGSESAHIHSAGTLATDSKAAHQHGPGTLSTDTELAHQHGPGTLATGAGGAHKHTITTANVTFGTSTAVGGNPNFIPQSSASHATSEVAHYGISGSTDNESLHTHGMVAGGLTGGGGAHSHALVATGLTGGGGAHSHDVTGNTGGVVSPAAGHTHSFTGNAMTTHSHSVSGSAASDGAHTHPLSGTTDSDGAHTTPISGSTGKGDAHTHTFTSGNTGDEALHTHDLGPLTSNAKGGDGAHNNVQPTLVINYLIYTGV